MTSLTRKPSTDMLATLRDRAHDALSACGVPSEPESNARLAAWSPIVGAELLELPSATENDVQPAVAAACSASAEWDRSPALERTVLVSRWGALLEHRAGEIAELLVLETGWLPSQAAAEVGAAIDACQRATALAQELSAQRPASAGGSLSAVGTCALISGFGRPLACPVAEVAVALQCGNAILWSPSPRVGMMAAAAASLLSQALVELGAPTALLANLCGGTGVERAIAECADLDLLVLAGEPAATAELAPLASPLRTRVRVELPPIGIAIVAPTADVDLAAAAIAHAVAAGAGQRPLSTRVVLAHRAIATQLSERLVAALRALVVGDPVSTGTSLGPLYDLGAFRGMLDEARRAEALGGHLLLDGAQVVLPGAPDAQYVEPSMIAFEGVPFAPAPPALGPLVHLGVYDEVQEAVALCRQPSSPTAVSVFGDGGELAASLAAGGRWAPRVLNVDAGTGVDGSAPPAALLQWQFHVVPVTRRGAANGGGRA